MGVLDDQRGRAARQVAHGAAPRAGVLPLCLRPAAEGDYGWLRAGNASDAG